MDTPPWGPGAAFHYTVYTQSRHAARAVDTVRPTSHNHARTHRQLLRHRNNSAPCPYPFQLQRLGMCTVYRCANWLPACSFSVVTRNKTVANNRWREMQTWWTDTRLLQLIQGCNLPRTSGSTRTQMTSVSLRPGLARSSDGLSISVAGRQTAG